MLQYKFHRDFRKDFFLYPCLSFIQKSSDDTNFDLPNDDNLIQDFLFFLDQFKGVCIIEEEYPKKFCEILFKMRNKDIIIPTEKIFNSPFPFCIIQTIQHILIQNPKGDRSLGPYMFALSYIIHLNNTFFDYKLILVIFEIISKYPNYTITLLHSLTCLNDILQNNKYDNIFFSQIENIFNLAFRINNSQAIVLFSQLLLLISKKQIESKYLHRIAQAFIHFVTNPIAGNDMIGVLCRIDEFISISCNHLIILVESGFIQNLPIIFNKALNCQNNQIIIDIIDKLSISPYFITFLFDENISSQLINLFCIKIRENYDDYKIKCINIMCRLINSVNNNSEFGNNIFIPLLKRSIIINELCIQMENSSFKLKNAISQLMINLIYTRHFDIINKLIKDEIIKIIIENAQLSGFLAQEDLILSLTICIDLCNNEYQKENLIEILKDVQEFEPI